MAMTAIALCSRALLRIGAASIASFDEGGAEAEIAASLYPNTRDAVLSSHPWSFATGQMKLPRLQAEPVADYAHAFQLPADFLRALSAGAGARGRGAEYRIAERRLHADTEDLVLTYIFRPAETDFPPFFDHMLVARLSAEFCIPLTESTGRAETMHKIAEEEYRRAKTIDSQQKTPGRIEDFALINARR
ncbi:MAG: hypothetical protein ACYYKD_04980 [Rhodospirillales bacterium]